MKLLLYVSDLMIPMMILWIVYQGIMKQIEVYQVFIVGAKEGMKTVIGIMPTLVGLMTAVGILRASGFLEWLGRMLGCFTVKLGFPGELMPLTIVKMFSSSASTGLLLDIYKNFGVDSFIGNIASISMSCSETVFYTMSVYFMAAKVTKTRYTMTGAMLAVVVDLVLSVWLAKWFMI